MSEKTFSFSFKICHSLKLTHRGRERENERERERDREREKVRKKESICIRADLYDDYQARHKPIMQNIFNIHQILVCIYFHISYIKQGGRQ